MKDTCGNVAVCPIMVPSDRSSRNRSSLGSQRWPFGIAHGLQTPHPPPLIFASGTQRKRFFSFSFFFGVASEPTDKVLKKVECPPVGLEMVSCYFQPINITATQERKGQILRPLFHKKTSLWENLTGTVHQNGCRSLLASPCPLTMVEKGNQINFLELTFEVCFSGDPTSQKHKAREAPLTLVKGFGG